MKKRYLKNLNTILIFPFFISIIIPSINTQIKIPLKLLKTSYLKYPFPKEIFITNTNSLYNLRHLKETLSVKIEILSSLLFACEINLGSNNQTFNVILDTGSQILWVPEINSDDGEVKLKNHYNPNISLTSKNTFVPFSIEYATGYTQGYFYFDKLKFLINEKYYIAFGSANKTVFNVDGADGIMGLGQNYFNYILSPLLTLKKNNEISSSKFSFKYDDDTDELFFFVGNKHSDFEKSNVAMCNLVTETTYQKMLWFCHLNAFGLSNSNNNKISVKTDFNILFDTGTNTMVLPYEILEEMKNDLSKFNCVIGSSSYSDDDNETSFVICLDLEKLPDISLNFGNYILVLSKYNMFFGVRLENGKKGYFLNAYFEKNLDTAIIGQSFFIEFHTLFDAENKILQFYSDYDDKIIFLNKKKEGGNSHVIIFLILIIIIIGIYFVYRYNKKRKNETQFEWMNYQLAGEQNNNGYYINNKMDNINNLRY